MAVVQVKISKIPVVRFFILWATLFLSIPLTLGAQESGDQKPDSFELEFKKIFGQSHSIKLSALEYLKKLVAGETDDEEFLNQIKLLGSENYQKRQEAEAFLFSVPILPEKFRDEISQNPDMEVRYRLKSIFAHRKNKVESLTVAALKAVAEKKQGEGMATVFRLLDTTGSSRARKTAVQTIRAIADSSHESILNSKLKSSQPSIRLLAARLFVRLNLDRPVERLAFLMTDEDEMVSLEVSKLLVDLNHKPAVETFVRLLKSQSISMATRSERVLRAISNQDFGNISFSDKEKNAEIAKAWSKWKTENLAEFKLNLPLKDFLKTASRLNGNTLIAKDQSIVVELDEDKNEIFRMKVSGVLSAEKTVDGNYLVFSYSSQWLREYSPDKKLVWEIKGLKFNNAMALGNGNVLVTIGPNSVVREIDPRTKKTVWEYKTAWWPNDAFRLENGNTLIGGKGGVIEVSPENKIVWKYENPDSGTIVVAKPTENDAILVGWTSGLAKEVNRDQKVIWQYKCAKLSDIFRDSNGNTFVATQSEIIELDPDKKTVWRYKKQSQTATVRR